MKKFICILITEIFFIGAAFAQTQPEDYEIPESDFDLSPIDFVLEEDVPDEVFKLRVESNGGYSYEDYKRDKTLNLLDKDTEPPLLKQFEARKDVDKDVSVLSQKLHYGTVSFGGTHKARVLDPDGRKTTSVFSKYKYKRLTLNTEYSRKVNDRDDEFNDKIKFSSEYNVYGDISLKYMIDKKIDSDTVGRGVGINYKPKRFDEILEFSADIQNKYTPYSDTSHQFNFETKFHF